MEKLTTILGGLPFMLLSEEGRPVLNKARIVEALLIAGISGMLGGYIAVQELKIEVNLLKHTIGVNDTVVRSELRKLDDRLYMHMQAVQQHHDEGQR